MARSIKEMITNNKMTKKKQEFLKKKKDLDLDLFECNLNKLAMGLSGEISDVQSMVDRIAMSEEALTYIINRHNNCVSQVEDMTNTQMKHINISELSSTETELFNAIMNARSVEEYVRNKTELSADDLKTLVKTSSYKLETVNMDTFQGELQLKQLLIQHIELAVALLSIMDTDGLTHKPKVFSLKGEVK